MPALRPCAGLSGWPGTVPALPAQRDEGGERGHGGLAIAGRAQPHIPELRAPARCQNSATAFDQGFSPACSYSLMSPPRIAGA